MTLHFQVYLSSRLLFFACLLLFRSSSLHVYLLTCICNHVYSFSRLFFFTFSYIRMHSTSLLSISACIRVCVSFLRVYLSSHVSSSRVILRVSPSSRVLLLACPQPACAAVSSPRSLEGGSAPCPKEGTRRPFAQDRRWVSPRLPREGMLPHPVRRSSLSCRMLSRECLLYV